MSNYQVEVTRRHPPITCISNPLTQEHATRLFKQLEHFGHNLHIKLIDISRPHSPLATYSTK